jgi:hypothetical protein
VEGGWHQLSGGLDLEPVYTQGARKGYRRGRDPATPDLAAQKVTCDALDVTTHSSFTSLEIFIYSLLSTTLL